MTALQHRGQDAAGVAVFNENSHFIKKSKGLINDIFESNVVENVQGNLGIGHTRYPTAGTDSDNETQPFLANASHKIATAHNGNLTNYEEIKQLLLKKGIFLDSSSDAEIINKILAYEIETKQSYFEAIETLMGRIEGSYSVVAAVGNKSIIAFRDPNGFRPLVIGEKEGEICVASESVVFQTLGFKRIKDVQPGEAVVIDKNLNITSKIIKQTKRAHCMFEWVYFARPESFIDDRSVYNARLKLGELLARDWKKEIDVVIPVPDTARAAAIKFAEVLGIKYREGLVKNRYLGRTFIMPTQKKRENAVRVKLNPIKAVVNGKRVAVIDDSIVRGTTSKKIIKLLRNAGAKEVHFISTCPPIKYPCHYGIDMPTKEELIANNQEIEEIRNYIDADSLTYQKIENIIEATKKIDLCMACLNGKYPLSISDKQKNEMAMSRVLSRKD